MHRCLLPRYIAFIASRLVSRLEASVRRFLCPKQLIRSTRFYPRNSSRTIANHVPLFSRDACRIGGSFFPPLWQPNPPLPSKQNDSHQQREHPPPPPRPTFRKSIVTRRTSSLGVRSLPLLCQVLRKVASTIAQHQRIRSRKIVNDCPPSSFLSLSLYLSVLSLYPSSLFNGNWTLIVGVETVKLENCVYCIIDFFLFCGFVVLILFLCRGLNQF